jgi:hypothetical protein
MGEWRELNPEKIVANNRARIIPIKYRCESCGTKAEVRHHPDYNKPLYSFIFVGPATLRPIHNFTEVTMVSLRDDLIRLLGEKLAGEVLSLLDKKVQEAGWVVSVDVTRALERDEGVTRPATLEELLNNKAHRTGGG